MLEKEMFGEKLFENITAATNRMEWLRCWKKRVILRNTLFLCDKIFWNYHWFLKREEGNSLRAGELVKWFLHTLSASQTIVKAPA